ncbi:host specificity factor TipJ family phage tail protein [Endozoicomonas sp. Mp262]|uniref:host specificity factor TipJ family phage tail protein n=1 Tax=Endozoicomonas sp. Mp262 TaxID=2919499 RepID=UPI0021D900A2
MKKATIIEWENILRPREGEVIHQVKAGQTLHQWMSDNVPGYSQELERQPVECIVSGKAVEPELWPQLVLREGEPVVLAVRPYAAGTAIYWAWAAAAAAAVAAVVAISSMPPPPSESVLPDASPTYDINAQGNQARLMNPIPFAVGYNRHWPDMLSQPWKEYDGNDQYLYQLFSLGWGEFDLEPLQIGDTEHSAYQDIEYEVYGPNDKVTLFPDNVDTSEEVAGIEMFGPNEEEYQDWSGPYVVVKKNQKANYLACDFSARGGIYGMNDDGDLYGRTAEIEIQYQEIDEDDKPAGSWQSESVKYSGATTTPQRWSHRWEVKDARYHVRVKRTNNASTSTKARDSVHWEQARAYYPSRQEYPGITKIAVRVRASNNLSQQSEKRFNIKATALTPEWTGNGWTKPTKNREIAWAFCNAIRSTHGGRLSDDLIDLDNILSLHQQWKLAGETVSRVFDTRGTLLGALQEIAAAGRGTVLTHNGKFYVVRDMQKLIRRSMYTPFMMPNPPSVERSFPQAGDNDSIIVEFYNQGIWDNDEILCQLPNHPAANPKRITLRSVANREQAYRIGIFECAKMIYRRMQISFTTEMQALNSMFGDKIGVSYWLQGWGQSGEIVAFDGLRATLSSDVELHPAKQNYISLCRPDGTMAGPYKIEAAGSNRVLLSEKPDFDIYTGDMQARTQFQIGTDGAFCKDFIVTSIAPAASGQVSVTAVYDNPVVYGFEALPVPQKGGAGDNLPRDVRPVISDLVIVQEVTDPQSATLSWQSTAGAREFVIDHSLDGKEWARVAVTTINTWSTRLFNGSNWFRVAGVADGQGDWKTGFIKLTGKDFDVPPSTTITLSEPFTGPALKVEWEPVLSADHYTVDVVKNSKVLYSVKQYKDTRWEYSAEQSVNSGSGRAFTVRVTPYNSKGVPGEPATLGVRNEPPAVPNNIQIHPLIDAFIVTVDGSNEPDLRDLRIWGSQAKGFSPGTDNLLQISEAARFDLNLKGSWFFRLAWCDVWGASEFNYSGEFSGTTAKLDMTEIEGDVKDLDDKINKGIAEVKTDISKNRQEIDKQAQETKAGLDKVRQDLNSEIDSNIADVKTDLSNQAKQAQADLAKARQDLGSDIDAAVTERVTADAALGSRVDTVAANLSTETANRTAAIKSEQEARTTADEALSKRVDTISSELSDETAARVAAVRQESEARTTADQSLSKKIDEQVAGFESDIAITRAGLKVIAQAQATSDESHSQWIRKVESEYQEGDKKVTALVHTEIETLTDADQALATRLDKVVADMTDGGTNTNAAIKAEQEARATADEAIGKRVDTVAASLSDETAARKAAITQEASARATKDTALGSQITRIAADLSTETKNRTAAIQQESTARAAKDESLAQQITTISSELSDETAARVAAIKKEESARTTIDEALSKRVDKIVADIASGDTAAGAAIKAEQEARATADEALSRQVTQAISDYKTADKHLQSSISSEASTRSGADYSLGQRIDKVTADYKSADSIINTAIQTEVKARAAADGALSSKITTAQAAVDDAKAAVQQQSTAIAQVKDGVKTLQAKWGVQMDVNGYCSGFQMNNDGKRSNALFRVDTFAVGSPGASALSFAVKDGKVVMPGVSIEDGGITAKKISVDNLAAVSANLGTITAGTFKTAPITGPRVEVSSVGNYPFWVGSGEKTEKNGQLYYDKNTNDIVYKGKLNIKSADTGGRLEIKNNFIRVYDEHNVLRVEIGELS